MANEVRIKITAQDAATPTLQSVRTSTIALGSALGTFVGQYGPQMVSSLGNLARGAINAASAMQESQSKVGQVFRGAARDITEFANDSSRNLLLSKQAAMEAAGTFGNLLTSLGQTRGGAAEMSISMVQLAQDLSSFNNIGTEEVLIALRSGLVGEVEPMRRLGVAMNATQVEAQALAMGLAKTKDELTEGDKVQARYALILAGTKNAQGDAARTAEGFANSSRALHKNLDDLQATIGQALLPVATDLTRELNNLISVHGEEWARQFAVAVDTMTTALNGAFGVLKDMVANSPYRLIVDIAGNAVSGASGAGGGNPLVAGARAGLRAAAGGIGSALAGVAFGPLAVPAVQDAIRRTGIAGGGGDPANWGSGVTDLTDVFAQAAEDFATAASSLPQPVEAAARALSSGSGSLRSAADDLAEAAERAAEEAAREARALEEQFHDFWNEIYDIQQEATNKLIEQERKLAEARQEEVNKIASFFNLIENQKKVAAAGFIGEGAAEFNAQGQVVSKTGNFLTDAQAATGSAVLPGGIVVYIGDKQLTDVIVSTVSSAQQTGRL